MKRTLKVLYVTVLLAALAAPSLVFFGAKESWHNLYGVEAKPKVPEFSCTNLANRAFQDAFTENFAKTFFLRKTFFTTAMQLRDWANFGKFHYGYHFSIADGEEGVLMEKPYMRFHLDFKGFDKAKYAKVIAKLKELDGFCQSIGADFAFLAWPDKAQAYPEYLPRWYHWFWNYRNHDVQADMAALLQENGLKAMDAGVRMRQLKRDDGRWLYPPGGTHLTALACGHVAEDLVKMLNAGGRSHLAINPFRNVVSSNGIWSVDDDISNLLNTWRNWHRETNVHYFPVFEKKGVVMNPGSAIVMGDCYRGQLSQIFAEAGLFEKKKIVQSQRKGQKAADFKNVIGDLKLVVLTHQSFNTGRLDERLEEIDSICQAMREARAIYDKAFPKGVESLRDEPKPGVRTVQDMSNKGAEPLRGEQLKGR